MKIAPLLNAGTQATPRQVPKGRLKDCARGPVSAVPSGLESYESKSPALKRRAIIRMSLRDKLEQFPDGIEVKIIPHRSTCDLPTRP